MIRQIDNDFLFFNEKDLSSIIQEQKNNLKIKIDNISEEILLTSDINKLVDKFSFDFKLDAPILDRNNILIAEKEEGETVINDYGNNLRIPGFEITFAIPFKGFKSLFKFAPNTTNTHRPYGEVGENELYLTYFSKEISDELLKQLNKELDNIEFYLTGVQKQCEEWNTELKKNIFDTVTARKEILIKSKNDISKLGLKVRGNLSSSNTYTVPIEPRTINVVSCPSSKLSSTQEPILSFDEYEGILKILSNMVLTMEKNPKTFKGMNEESLRDILLVQLNSLYKGQASGETFNHKGKTDILIQWEGKNIFIGECKFWVGKEKYSETIDQILSYLSWRDTKCAILIFNKNKNLSNVLSKIIPVTKEHHKYKRDLPCISETNFRFIFSSNQDCDREIILSVLVFDIPK